MGTVDIDTHWSIPMNDLRYQVDRLLISTDLWMAGSLVFRLNTVDTKMTVRVSVSQIMQVICGICVVIYVNI